MAKSWIENAKKEIQKSKEERNAQLNGNNTNDKSLNEIFREKYGDNYKEILKNEREEKQTEQNISKTQEYIDISD